VSDDIKRGRLVRLSLDAWDDTQYRFHPVHRSDTPLGPAASWLMERLAIDAWDDAQYSFHTVHRSDTPLGPAASWLMERLAMAR